MESSPQLVYKVRDLNEAAAILCVGIDLLSSEVDANGRVYFVFQETQELQTTVKGYWNCTLQVNARRYADAIKTLKNVIYKDRP